MDGVAIFGTNGYLGGELNRLILRRKDVEIVYIANSKEVWGDLKKASIAFLAIPAPESLGLAPDLLSLGIKVIDLSGAYRLKNIDRYPEYYGFKHRYPELLTEAVYGLPEMNREQIKKARLIANPGCYATAVILGLLPLQKKGLLIGNIDVGAASGYSGAGKDKEPPKWAHSYKPDREHQHVPEIEQELEITDKLHFFPEITPFFRGLACYISLKAKIKEGRLIDLYESFYQKEPFIRIISREKRIKRGFDVESQFSAVIGKVFCEISVSTLGTNEDIKIVVLLDNLLKGGASQAIQNFNIISDLPETNGLQ